MNNPQRGKSGVGLLHGIDIHLLQGFHGMSEAPGRVKAEFVALGVVIPAMIRENGIANPELLVDSSQHKGNQKHSAKKKTQVEQAQREEDEAK